jgi:hypothetical protein
VHVINSASNQRTHGTWQAKYRLGIKARDMEAVVAALESFGRVETRQINGLGLGDLSRTDPNAVGAIDLVLFEKATIAPAPERAGQSIRAKVRDALAGLYASLGYIVYGLVVLAPWLMIVLVVAWLVSRAWRRRARSAVATAKS